MSATACVTVLVENTASGPGLLGEHGLAYWIEFGDRHVLFDTGQTRVLVDNASTLGVDLDQLDAIVLSHGHYDHTGGLASVIRGDGPVELYAHTAAFAPKFARKKDEPARRIGIPLASQAAIRCSESNVTVTDRPTVVCGSLTATGPIPRETAFEDTGGAFFLDPTCQQPDPLTDDQSLFFESAAGTVVLLGCAHAGVINTLRYVRRLTDDRPIHAVCGGMHLLSASVERLSWTIEELRRLDVQRLGPAHCTGPAATARLWQAFPDACFACHVGMRTVFDLP